MTRQDLSTRDIAQTTDEGRPEPDAADLNQRDDRRQDEAQRDEARTDAAQNETAEAGDAQRAETPGEQKQEVTAAHEPLLAADEGERYRTRWQEIQVRFVDEPQQSVEQADMLVADLMQRLAAVFSDERGRLEAQWEGGDDVSTEDLRVALTRYRSFFDRLLSA
jgi:hypothetical protein